MILCLTIAAFFDSIAYVMGDVHPDGVLCNFQAWWLTYFDWCSLAWVCLITLNLYLNLVKEMKTDRFEIWYIPLFTLIFLMTLCYVRIIYVAKERVLSWSGTFNPEREWRKLSEEIKPLKWYPSVYLMVSLFPLINRLHNAFNPLQPVFSLTLLHVISAPLHGLANAFVFGLDKDTWGQLSFTSMQPGSGALQLQVAVTSSSCTLARRLAMVLPVLHNAFNPLQPVFSLTLLHVISAPLHGLANAFVFGLDKDTWGQLSFTSMQLAMHSRLCDRTLIKEYRTGAVRYVPLAEAGSLDLGDDDDGDTTVLFYSPAMTLNDRGP
ncbi:UNVERIFIED_CONTAM: hypothetical protein FKN15_023407 [Acipenser sinensis]